MRQGKSLTMVPMSAPATGDLSSSNRRQASATAPPSRSCYSCSILAELLAWLSSYRCRRCLSLLTCLLLFCHPYPACQYQSTSLDHPLIVAQLQAQRQLWDPGITVDRSLVVALEPIELLNAPRHDTNTNVSCNSLVRIGRYQLGLLQSSCTEAYSFSCGVESATTIQPKSHTRESNPTAKHPVQSPATKLNHIKEPNAGSLLASLTLKCHPHPHQYLYATHLSVTVNTVFSVCTESDTSTESSLLEFRGVNSATASKQTSSPVESSVSHPLIPLIPWYITRHSNPSTVESLNFLASNFLASSSQTATNSICHRVIQPTPPTVNCCHCHDLGSAAEAVNPNIPTVESQELPTSTSLLTLLISKQPISEAIPKSTTSNYLRCDSRILSIYLLTHDLQAKSPEH